MKQFKFWGIILSFLFLGQLSIAQSAWKINKGEYFYDTDPGPGKATAINITTPSDSVVLKLALPTTGLAAGFHNLFIRFHYPAITASKDTNAVWGLYQGRSFYIFPAGSVLNAAMIDHAEYFFDKDPGLGKGTGVTVSAATDSSNLSIPISIASLSAGFHNLFIRYHYNNGLWGLYEGRTIYTFPVNTGNSTLIDHAEYFFDKDPGLGKGTGITVATPSDSSVLVLNSISVSSLVPGFHALFIRFHESNGRWGLYEGRTIYVIPPFNLNGATISKGEYFFDKDPGLGKGTAITIGTPSDSVNQLLNLPTSSLATGFHQLFIRYQYSTGEWGLYEGRAFYIIPPNTLPNPAHINSAEYFFDTDPGVGKGHAIVVSPAADSVVQALNISVSGLSKTTHNLFIRYRYNDGQWGLYEGRKFKICTVVPTASVAITAGDTAFCIGKDSALFSANTGFGYTYQWQRNGGNITGATSITYVVKDSSGAYDVVVTDTSGCNATSDSDVIRVAATPRASFTYSQNYDTVTFTNQSSGATSYEWIFGDGTTSLEKNPTHVYALGSFNAMLVALDPPCGNDTVSQNIDVISTGTYNIKNALGVSVYPNPTMGLAQIVLNGNYDNDNVTIQLYNTLGQMVYAPVRQKNKANYNIDMSNLAAGTYFLQVKTFGLQGYYKIVHVN